MTHARRSTGRMTHASAFNERYMEQLTHNHSEDTSELLSAYSDDAVDVVERRRAEQYLARCAACGQELRELRMLKQILRDLPSVQPRRSFTIDPATVAPPRRLIFPTLRWASLVATLLLVVLLGVDALGGSMAESPQSSATMQRQADDSAGGTTAMEFAPRAAPAAEQPAAAAMPESAPMPTAEASPAASLESAAGASANDAPASSPQLGAENDAATASEQGGSDLEQQTLKAPPESLDETGAALRTEELADVSAAATTEESAASTAIEPQAAWSGLRIAQLITAITACVLAIAAWITWRRQV